MCWGWPACTVQAKGGGAGHMGWPSQLAQGKLCTGRLGEGLISLHWAGGGGGEGGICHWHLASVLICTRVGVLEDHLWRSTEGAQGFRLEIHKSCR